MSQQPYDSSIKAIFKEDAPGIVPLLLEGAIFIDELDIEVLRPPMRADRAFRIIYKGKSHAFQLEFQTNEDEEIEYRVLVYHTVLLKDYRLPVISMIIYLFKSNVVESPFREMSGDENLLTFHYRVVRLWTLDARQYVQAQEICMYTLLPAMKNADAQVLLQAIDGLVERFKENETKLAQRLLWLSTFLRRSDMVALEDKQRVEERLDTFEQLLEQDEFVRKQRALGEEAGEVKEARRILVRVVNRR